MAALRALLAIAVAIVAGLALTFIDSSPDYGAVISAAGLAIAAFVVVLIDGSGRALRVAMLAVLVGIWVPVLQISPPGTYGSLLALVFAAAGAVAGMLVLRAARSAAERARGDAAAPTAQEPPLPPPSEPPLTPPPDQRD